nr:hypothetical protein Iba_chr09cCG2480 [Ipomoea batatas]GMD35094.1 hypothetical protein Iba_chr09dCG3670 [Ipomoea batatas]GMD38403.1 hypothetical protein Iba_chr09fCG3610 [Ipomoea batatas]
MWVVELLASALRIFLPPLQRPSYLGVCIKCWSSSRFFRLVLSSNSLPTMFLFTQFCINFLAGRVFW